LTRSIASFAHETALLFPTGGSHWPGMGEDLDRLASAGPWIDRAERALGQLGVASGALRRLMAGEGQVKRVAAGDGWAWEGDFPLSVAAQTVVGAGLGEAFLKAHGLPRIVAGESMGECAAYCVAGALPVEAAVLVAWRWAKALQLASDALGLRMVVVEYLDRMEVERLGAQFEGVIVVEETPTLFVLSLPMAWLAAMQQEVRAAGGTCLVSGNPCVAHDPRLGRCREVWDDYREFVLQLDWQPTRVSLLSALHPGESLDTAARLRDNLIATTTNTVRWDTLVRLLPGMGIRHLWQLGVPTRAYALDKLRSEDPALAGVKVRAVRTLAAVLRSPGPGAPAPP
jgi:acyl transferase domain-containing protein